MLHKIQHYVKYLVTLGFERCQRNYIDIILYYIIHVTWGLVPIPAEVR